MPEGHTIHRLSKDLNRAFRSKSVEASSPQGRFEAGAARLDGTTCVEFEAWGKHLFATFDSGDVLHVHLGLIGGFRREKGEPTGSVRLRLSDEDTHWDLRGPMVCTLGGPQLIDDVTIKLGPDPLRKDGKVDDFVARMGRKRVAVGAALLDQSVIAGIGNVYRSEFLFMLGIDPRIPANHVDDEALRSIWKTAVAQLRLGMRLNRIVTVDPSDVGAADFKSVPRHERVFVYKRQGSPCRVCSDTIEQFDVAGRKMWACPTCQPTR